MEDKVFILDDILEVPNIINNIVEKEIDNIKNNYDILTKDAFKIVELSVNNAIVKPLTLYNLFFLVEIFLKSFLIKNSRMEQKKIAEKGHNIYELIAVAKIINPKIKFDRLKFLIGEFTKNDGKKIEIQKYYDFKYNQRKEESELLFDYDITDNEIKNIKEVMSWINYHM